MGFPILQIIIVSNPEVTIFNLILTSTCQQKAFLPFILRVSLKNRETGLFCSLLHYLLKSFSPEHIPLSEFTLLYACTHMISIVTSRIQFPFTNNSLFPLRGTIPSPPMPHNSKAQDGYVSHAKPDYSIPSDQWLCQEFAHSSSQASECPFQDLGQRYSLHCGVAQFTEPENKPKEESK